MGQGGQHSSAFAQQLGAAGSDLESQLAGMRSQFGLQQQGQQMGWLQHLLGLGMQSPYENQGMPGTSGFINGLIPAAVDAGGKIIAAYAKGA
jgi:hypothetical protein